MTGAGWTDTAPGGSSAGSRTKPGSASLSARTRCRHAFITRLPVSTPECHCATSKRPFPTPTRGPRMRYDRARGSLDRHATYIVAAYVAGAAR